MRQLEPAQGLQPDACGPGYPYDSNQRLRLESKGRMRARGVPLAHEWDAVALIFAEPVSPQQPLVLRWPRVNGGWMSY